MWNAAGNNFWTGTGDDGVTPFKDVIPLDTTTLGWFAITGALMHFGKNGATSAAGLAQSQRHRSVSQ
jgi:hypothetical protein